MIGHRGRGEEGESTRTIHGCSSLGLLMLVYGFIGVPLATAANYAGGSGTQAAPYLIATAADFKAIGDNAADWDKQFLLTQNIDLSDYNEVNLHMIGHWVMLGSTANQPFRGVFDGNGKTIANFRYMDASDDYVGLFQYVTGSIKNLRLVGPTVVGNKLGTGSLVGNLESGGVQGCSATRVNVTGNARVGGLVGSVDGMIATSWSNGSVSGVQYVGGLVGQIGIGIVSMSYSKAQVSGRDNVGGLAGLMLQQASIVQWCYATGDVEGTTYVAGLVGQVSAGSVNQCYSVGSVTGVQPVGGLVAYQRALAQVLSSLWDTQTSKQTTSFGGTGKTTDQMKSLKTFTTMNWDFVHTWTICEGVGYPVLVWQIPVGDLVCPDGVNFIDFAWFALDWRSRGCTAVNGNCDGADLDQSGVVDFRDLAILAENWLTGVQ